MTDLEERKQVSRNHDEDASALDIGNERLKLGAVAGERVRSSTREGFGSPPATRELLDVLLYEPVSVSIV